MTPRIDWSVPIAVLSLVGAYWAGEHQWWGWALNAGAAALWCAFGVRRRHWGLVLECGPLTAVHLVNLVKEVAR